MPECLDHAAESALTIGEVARALWRSTDFVYRLIITGQLAGARKESGRWLVPPCDVRTYVKATRCSIEKKANVPTLSAH